MKKIAIDFDGVLAQYDGWNGAHKFGKPNKKMDWFLNQLMLRYDIILFTTRPEHCVMDWLNEYSQTFRNNRCRFSYSYNKPIAHVYLDDRALLFDGKFNSSLINKINNFKTWWEK